MKPTLTLLFVLSLVSCQRECHNTNPIFDSNTPESKAYQDELIRQLKSESHSDLSYTLENYKEKDGIPYLYVDLNDDGLCATAVIKVLKWDANAAGIRDKKAVGYSGAGLIDLKFDMVQKGGKTELVYKSIDGILD